MAKVLYIESSPRKQRSSSIIASKFFFNEYQKHNPNDIVVTIDLWKKELPPFDGNVIDAKYAIMHGRSKSAAEAKAWKAVEAIIAEFKDADKYVISLPMWNFSIPYKLKHYIDLLVQPGYAFSFSPEEGYKGLITNKKMLLICARGGAYGAETGGKELDLQTRYMKEILQFIGFKDIQSIIIELTMGAEGAETALQKAQEEAKQLAVQF